MNSARQQERLDAIVAAARSASSKSASGVKSLGQGAEELATATKARIAHYDAATDRNHNEV